MNMVKELLLYLALAVGLCAPIHGAEMAIDGKDEKQEQELKAKALAHALPDQIPFIDIPEDRKVRDKQGQIVNKEVLSLDEEEPALLDSYRNIIQEQLDKGKPAVIARIVIDDGSKDKERYYELNSVLKYMAIHGHKDPVTRTKAKSLTYFFYSPEFEGFMFACGGYHQPVAGQPVVRFTLPGVPDKVRSVMARHLYNGTHCKKDKKKAREIFEDVSAHALLPTIKIDAQYALSMVLYYGSNNVEDYKKARELFEYQVTQPFSSLTPNQIVQLCTNVAIEYYENRAQLLGQYHEQAWEYTQKVLVNPEPFNNDTDPHISTNFYLVAGALHYTGTAKHKPHYEQAEKLLHKALVCATTCEKNCKKSNEAQARVHALLGCVYYEDTTPRADRYTQAIYHFGNAMKICNNQKHFFKEVIDALPYMAEMYFYGIGTERDAKSAFAIIEDYKKQNPGKELPERMKNIIGFHEQFKAADEQARKKADSSAPIPIPKRTNRVLDLDSPQAEAPSAKKSKTSSDDAAGYIVGPSPLSKH